ncbi:MAG: cytidine deaminase [Bacteroidetes bacterium]|nr:cytidine deaminase [Bacteroidota bacterium]
MDFPKDIIDALITAAREAREFAHAPYSGFRVGAALLCSDGSVFTGCNVENSSFSLTCCAERSAVFSAVGEGRTEFDAIAIVADGEAVPPCGACRQVLSEFAPDLHVILLDKHDEHRILTLTNLLPEPFSARYLKD